MPEGASLSSLVLGPYDISRGDSADRDLLDPKLSFSSDTQCLHSSGTRHAVSTELPEPMLSVIDHITFGTYWQHGSMSCSQCLWFPTHTREMVFLASNYTTPRWSIFIISLVVGLFQGFFFLAQKLRRPELGHFRNDVEEIRLPVSIPDFFPLSSRISLEDRNSNFRFIDES